MRNLTRMVIALAAIGTALPALGGSWPLIPPRKSAPAPVVQSEPARESRSYTPFRTEEHERVYLAATGVGAGKAVPADGFTLIGGEALYQLTPHKLVWVGGRLAHSNECDHAIRQAQAPMPSEVDAERLRSPGG